MRYDSKRFRQSTRDKFTSYLHGEKPAEAPRLAWFKKKSNMYPFLMIIVFTFLYMAVRVFTVVRSDVNEQETVEAAVQEEAMDYEEAQRIFNQTSKE